jgi:hypothetical protein
VFPPIGYIIKDTSLHFNITSQHRGTEAFAAHVARALRDMKTLLEITAQAAASSSATSAPRARL